MDRLRLCDIADFILDGTHSSPMRTEHGIPVLSAQHVSDGALSYETDRFTSSKEYEQFVRRVSIQTGDLLLTIVGTIGRSAVVTEVKPAVFQRSVAILRFDRARVDPTYVYHLTKSHDFKAQLRKYSNQSAQAGVYLGKLGLIEIPLPPLNRQKRIATILDQADGLRRKRQRALDLLNSLGQSIFLTMFGDPSSNPKKWPYLTLGDVIQKASDGPHVSPAYSQSGVPFLSTRHVQRGAIVWEDLKYIDEAEAEIQWKKCRPERGDILYTKGGTTGIAAMVDTDVQFAVWVHVALLKPNRERVEPLWLESMLNSEYCYRQSQRYTHGIANRDLGLTRMVKIKLYLPPKSEQRRFVDAMKALSNLKKHNAAASSGGTLLLSSLQHRAFSGRL
jgi:type I restriction enzyme S subunit